MLRLPSHAAAQAGIVVTPYRSRSTNSLLLTARLLTQRGVALPVVLVAALQERGIETSSL